MDNEELTLFRDMARRAFEQLISPHYEAWEEKHLVPRELWNQMARPDCFVLTCQKPSAGLALPLRSASL